MDKYHSRVQICQIKKKHIKNNTSVKYFFTGVEILKKIVNWHKNVPHSI